MIVFISYIYICIPYIARVALLSIYKLPVLSELHDIILHVLALHLHYMYNTFTLHLNSSLHMTPHNSMIACHPHDVCTTPHHITSHHIMLDRRHHIQYRQYTNRLRALDMFMYCVHCMKHNLTLLLHRNTLRCIALQDTHTRACTPSTHPPAHLPAQLTNTHTPTRTHSQPATHPLTHVHVDESNVPLPQNAVPFVPRQWTLPQQLPTYVLRTCLLCAFMFKCQCCDNQHHKSST